MAGLFFCITLFSLAAGHTCTCVRVQGFGISLSSSSRPSYWRMAKCSLRHLPLYRCVSCAAVYRASNDILRRLRRRQSAVPPAFPRLFFSLYRSKLPDCLRHDVLVCRQLLRAGLLLWPTRTRRNGRCCQTRGRGLAPVRNTCYGAEGPDPSGNVGLLR